MTQWNNFHLRALRVVGLAVLDTCISGLSRRWGCSLCQPFEVGKCTSPDALVEVVPIAEVVVLTRDTNIVFDWKVVLSSVSSHSTQHSVKVLPCPGRSSRMNPRLDLAKRGARQRQRRP